MKTHEGISLAQEQAGGMFYDLCPYGKELIKTVDGVERIENIVRVRMSQ
jgi:hypothetical protein